MAQLVLMKDEVGGDKFVIIDTQHLDDHALEREYDGKVALRLEITVHGTFSGWPTDRSLSAE